MDSLLRNLERQAARGDILAQQQLVAFQIRSGIKDYGTIPNRIWSFLKFPEIGGSQAWGLTRPQQKRDVARLACAMAKTQPGQRLLIATYNYLSYNAEQRMAPALALAIDERYPVFIPTSYSGISVWESYLAGKGTVASTSILDIRPELKLKTITSRAMWRGLQFVPGTIYLACFGEYGLKQHIPIPPKTTMLLAEPERDSIEKWIEKFLASYGRIWQLNPPAGWR